MGWGEGLVVHTSKIAVHTKIKYNLNKAFWERFFMGAHTLSSSISGC